jgi:hypothetical protein
MTLALPREIMNKVEQRWNARATQTETFAPNRPKQHEQIAPEDVGTQTSDAPIKRN